MKNYLHLCNFSGTESKKLKTIQNLLSLNVNHFSSNFNKIQIFFWFFTETLTLSFHVPRWAGDTTDLPSNSKISKAVKVNTTRTLFKECSISFLIICRLIDFAPVVLKLLMFKDCGIISISKITFFQFLRYWKRERLFQ